MNYNICKAVGDMQSSHKYSKSLKLFYPGNKKLFLIMD